MIKITSHHRPMICRIGQHETGHYISARILGFVTGSITLTIVDLQGGHSASSEIAPACPLTDIQSIINYLERRVIVLYSGAHAESLTQGRLDNDLALKSIRTGGGLRDYDKARELIRLLRNIKSPNSNTEEEIQLDLDTIDNDLWNRAATIVESEHCIIEGLGDRIASEIKHIGQTFTLDETDLEKLPAIQERFGKSKESRD